MPSIIKYIFSNLLLLVVVASLAQDAEQKPDEKKEKLPPKDFSPTGFRLGTDLIDLIKTETGSTFKGWEVNGDVDFANYYLAVDVGSWAKDLQLGNGNYSNSGNYFRMGVDINLLGKDPDKNMFFFGFRVGHSNFSESLNYTATSSAYPTVPYTVYPSANYVLSNGNVKGGWAEVTTGLRVKVWKGLWMGYTARLKFAPSTKGGVAISPYDMPGYGIVSRAPWWGFNYQMFWRFAWKKDKPVVINK
ncbi:MAG: hypothetical protein JST48_00960 [Bacteroidetes bacterium]|nr:hypothetical protein [Bacteroidota bacterium]